MTNAALVAKLVSAKEGSRELDALIHIALHDPDIMTGTGGYRGELPVKYQKASTVFTETWTDWDGAALAMDAPHYTTNLQAAVDLVPEGARIELQNISTVPDGVFGCVVQLDYENDGPVGTGGSYQPALALCVAILRALDGND